MCQMLAGFLCTMTTGKFIPRHQSIARRWILKEHSLLLWNCGTFFFLKGKRTASSFLERIQKTTCHFYTGINITLIRSAPKISEFSTIYCYTFGPYSIIVTVTVISIVLLGCKSNFSSETAILLHYDLQKVYRFRVQVCRASWLLSIISWEEYLLKRRKSCYRKLSKMREAI